MKKMQREICGICPPPPFLFWKKTLVYSDPPRFPSSPRKIVQSRSIVHRGDPNCRYCLLLAPFPPMQGDGTFFGPVKFPFALLLVQIDNLLSSFSLSQSEMGEFCATRLLSPFLHLLLKAMGNKIESSTPFFSFPGRRMVG